MTDYLSTLSPATRKAYSADFRAFTRWHGTLAPVIASQAAFYQLTREWKVAMESEGLQPSTIRRRMAALRGYAMHAHHTGVIAWQPNVPAVRVPPPQDTAGPGVDVLRVMIERSPPRDALACALLGVLGLRLNEVRLLDLEHVDRKARTLRVMRKGKGNASQLLSFPKELDPLLTRWLAERGIASGPLFVRMDSRGLPASKRLGEKGLYNAVARAGSRAGVDTHPHALRHTAITEAMRAAARAGIPIEDVRDFSGHRTIAMMMVYRDNDADMQPKLAEMVAATVIGGRDEQGRATGVAAQTARREAGRGARLLGQSV